jgi:hypothetical protein
MSNELNLRNTAIGSALDLPTDTPGLEGSAVALNGYNAAKISYKANNVQHHKTLKAKVADIFYKAASIKITDTANYLDSPVARDDSGNNAVANIEQKPTFIIPAENFKELTLNDNDLEATVRRLTDEIALNVYPAEMTGFGGKLEVKDGKVVIEDYALNVPLAQTNVLPAYVKMDQTLTPSMFTHIYDKMFTAYPILSSPQVKTELSFDRPVKLSEILLSRMHSSDHLASSDLIERVIAKESNKPIIGDALKIIGLGIAQGAEMPIAPIKLHYEINDESGNPIYLEIERKEPLRIIHSLDKSELVNLAHSNAVTDGNVGGFYSPEYNLVAFGASSAFGHEATHAAMNILYNNGCNPYPNTHGQAFEAYQTAAKSLLNATARMFHVKEEVIANQTTADLIKILKNQTPSIFCAIGEEKSLLDDNRIKVELANRYFPEKQALEITFEILLERARLFEVEFKLNDDEWYILRQMSKLIYIYPLEEFDNELIALGAHSMFYEAESQTVVNFFKPLHEYANKFIHPQVETLLQAHNTQCNKEFYLKDGSQCKTPELFQLREFEHCIEDYLL